MREVRTITHGGFGSSEQDAKQSDQSRKIVKDARRILRQSLPDTFLGRKTQEPFPKEEPVTEGIIPSTG
jgi:hypothetical protein